MSAISFTKGLQEVSNQTILQSPEADLTFFSGLAFASPLDDRGSKL
jgi:hypothetical protein